MPGRWRARVEASCRAWRGRLAALESDARKLSDILGHCFVVGDNICYIISCVPGALGIEASTLAGWLGSMPGRNVMLENISGTYVFEAAGLRCRAGRAVRRLLRQAGMWRARCQSLHVGGLARLRRRAGM